MNWLGNTCDDVMSVSRRTKVGEERLSINSKCDPMGKSFKSKRKAKMATALKDNMNNSDLPVVVQSSSSSETMSRKSDSLNLKRFQIHFPFPAKFFLHKLALELMEKLGLVSGSTLSV